MSQLRRHVEAQLRQLKREAPRCPWLMPRLAALLLEAGRVREAATLIRKHAPQFENSTDGLLVRAELAEREGRESAAALLWEELCHRLPGIHQGWMQLMAASRDDSIRHLELVRGAWELDQFSARLNNEMEKSGLRRTADYEQALRPTAAEAARRERQFRRLLDQHAHGADLARSEQDAATQEAESFLESPAEQLVELDALLPACEEGPSLDQVLEAGHAVESFTGGEAELIDGEEEFSTVHATVDATATEPAHAEHALAEPVHADHEQAFPAMDEEESGSAPPPSPQRERQLVEQSERLAGLTRPLRLPVEQGVRKSARDADLFDARSMMTRRLAAIYLEQGYPALARRTLEVLQTREPDASDLAERLAQAVDAERRLAESSSAPGRRRAGSQA